MPSQDDVRLAGQGASLPGLTLFCCTGSHLLGNEALGEGSRMGRLSPQWAAHTCLHPHSVYKTVRSGRKPASLTHSLDEPPRAPSRSPLGPCGCAFQLWASCPMHHPAGQQPQCQAQVPALPNSLPPSLWEPQSPLSPWHTLLDLTSSTSPSPL